MGDRSQIYIKYDSQTPYICIVGAVRLKNSLFRDINLTDENMYEDKRKLKEAV